MNFKYNAIDNAKNILPDTVQNSQL